MNILPPSRELFLFIAAALVLLITPGPSVLYIVARSIDRGRKAGLASCIGIYTGGLVHVMAATCGLSALLVSSAVAYSFVKYAGAIYLIYLGINKLREDSIPDDEIEQVPPRSLRHVYTQGVLVQVFNPKTAIFFLAFLPQFVNPARGNVSLQFLTLGLIVTLLALITDSLWAMTAGSAAGWLQRNKTFLRNEKYVSGTVYIGLGLITAASGSKHHVLGTSRSAH